MIQEKKEKNIGTDKIIVKGARTHNLKNITVEMPRNKMIVFTGLSGSGKSSLAFDTIFAEGQRRYVESLSSYARQFLRQMQKPDVDEIIGLSPAISIDQKSRSNNPRSNVATITEIYDYLRVLFARIGHPHCLLCGKEITKLSNEEIKSFIFEKMAEKGFKDKKNIELSAPIVKGRKGEYYQLLYDMLGKGYSEVIIDGVRKNLREQIILDKNKRHSIDVLVDQIKLIDFKTDLKNADLRLSESLEKALDESDGLIRVSFKGSKDNQKELEFIMSSKFACPHDGYSYPEIEPRLFSFNSPYGACPECNGLGTAYFFGNEPCSKCKGARLRDEALHVLIGGKNIVQITEMTIDECKTFFDNLELTLKEKNISKVPIKEIQSRINSPSPTTKVTLPSASTTTTLLAKSSSR